MNESKLIRTVWPLPGGNNQYLATLAQIVKWAAGAETLTRHEFGEWLMAEFNIGRGALNGYLQVVTSLGILTQQKDGGLAESELAKQLFNSDEKGKAQLVLDQFMCSYLAFPEVLHLYAQAARPVHVTDVVKFLQPQFPQWTSSAQFEYRVLWLLSLGCLRQVTGRNYEITAFGREIADQYPNKPGLEEERVENNRQLTLVEKVNSPTMVAVDRPTPLLEGERNSPTPHLPLYAQAQSFLRILEGVPYSDYRTMYNEIWSQRGNPQDQADWLDPEIWIPERLAGTEKELAWRIWHESTKSLNPRYIRGCWYFAIKHDLLVRNQADTLVVTEQGRRFLNESDREILARIDIYEGIWEILRTVAEKGPGRRSEFLGEYTEYCHRQTTIQSLNVIKSYLYNRLQNLVDRGFVVRRGQNYEVTDAGLSYLDGLINFLPGSTLIDGRQSNIHKLAKEMRDRAREQLSEYLSGMDPFKFEALIKLLLEEMGYEDVTVTSATNDKGVDVIAHIELGISSVREVIQAKRHKGSINRTVMDQLRGSLHRFDAVRGTIITTGRFSKGVQQAAFERGAAPITLIDGEKLLDLLMDHQIGVVKRNLDYFEFDGTKLQQFDSEPTADEL